MIAIFLHLGYHGAILVLGRRMTVRFSPPLPRGARAHVRAIDAAARTLLELVGGGDASQNEAVRAAALRAVGPLVDPLLYNRKDTEQGALAIVAAHLRHDLGPRGVVMEEPRTGRHGVDGRFVARASRRAAARLFAVEVKSGRTGVDGRCIGIVPSTKIGTFDRVPNRVTGRGRAAHVPGRNLMRKQRGATNFIAFVLRTPHLAHDPMFTFLVDPNRLARVLSAPMADHATRVRAKIRATGSANDGFSVSMAHLFQARARLIDINTTALKRGVHNGTVRLNPRFLEGARSCVVDTVRSDLEALTSLQERRAGAAAKATVDKPAPARNPRASRR